MTSAREESELAFITALVPEVAFGGDETTAFYTLAANPRLFEELVDRLSAHLDKIHETSKREQLRQLIDEAHHLEPVRYPL